MNETNKKINPMNAVDLCSDVGAYEKAITKVLVEKIPEGLAVFDQNKNVIMTNTLMMRMTGLSQEGFYLSELSRLFAKHLDLDAEVDRVLTTTTTTTTYPAVPLLNFFYDIQITSIIDDNRNLIGGVIILRDVTREKEIEKLRIDFLTLAAHQLRTPLSGTKWLIETMRRKVLGPVTPRQKEYIDEIYKVNERMIKLVFDMLNVLRLGSGVTIVKKETIPVSEFYEQLSITMDSAAKSRGVARTHFLRHCLYESVRPLAPLGEYRRRHFQCGMDSVGVVGMDRLVNSIHKLS